MPIPIDDVCLNKAAIMERAIRRIRQEYRANPELNDHTHVDALTLNIERACQAAIDLAMHIVARERLGMPQSSAESFKLLQAAGYLSVELTKAMSAMTGFRNIAIHEYQQMDVSVLRDIAETHWQTLVEFCSVLGLTIQII